jgi:hypothetical protein
MTEPLAAPRTFADNRRQAPRLTLVARSGATGSGALRREYRRPKVTEIRTVSAHGRLIATGPLAA